MPAESGESLKDLSVTVEKELDRYLREMVRLERCRSYRQMVIFLLEVMVGVARQRPWLHLTLEPKKGTCLKGRIRALIPISLYDSLEETAHEYGMQVTEIVRVFLLMALGYHKILVPPNEIVSKEELISRILDRIKSQ